MFLMKFFLEISHVYLTMHLLLIMDVSFKLYNVDFFLLSSEKFILAVGLSKGEPFSIRTKNCFSLYFLFSTNELVSF